MLLKGRLKPSPSLLNSGFVKCLFPWQTHYRTMADCMSYVYDLATLNLQGSIRTFLQVLTCLRSSLAEDCVQSCIAATWIVLYILSNYQSLNKELWL